MDKTLPPLEQLDLMLSYFVNNEKPYKQDADVRSELEFRELKEMFQMLFKLEKDGYIKLDNNPIEGTGRTSRAWSCSFEGRLFYLNGGYKQELENKRIALIIYDRNEKRIVRNERWLLRGTWFAGIAAFLLLLWYIFVWYFPSYSHYPYEWFWQK